MAMNAALKAMMETDIDTTIADWSETLTFKGATVTGTFSPVDSGDDINEQGILDTASAQFVCRASLFDALATVPVFRDTVDIAGTKYHIVSILRDPACVAINVRRN